jgi:glucosamine kinase
MPLFLGIDGGGTQTSCLVGDEHSVLGSGGGGGCNLLRVGENQAHLSLNSAISQACAAAKIESRQISRTCVGIGGALRPAISVTIRQILSQLLGGERLGGEIQIVGDMVVARESAFGSSAGVIVISGTGSIAYGKNSSGETARAGGWGHAISDEGSGHWIGRRAVSELLRAHDEKNDPPLLGAIMKAWNLAGVDELVLATNQPPADFSMLAPAIVSAADAGDQLASDILAEAGDQLAKLAGVVIGRLFQVAPTYTLAVPVAVAGGIFRNSVTVRGSFYNNLRAQHPQATVRPSIVEPVLGALAMARKM